MSIEVYAEPTMLEDLQSHYSDFYKEVHGFRPRFASDEQWNSEEWLEESINDLHAYLKALDETPTGREELRCMGFFTSDKSADAEFAAAQRAERAAEESYWMQRDADCAVLEELLAPMSEAELIEAQYA
jgi:hypothetical protein